MKRYDYEWSPSYETYFILDRKRGTDHYEPYSKAVAETKNVADAELIVNALNAMEAPV